MQWLVYKLVYVVSLHKGDYCVCLD